MSPSGQKTAVTCWEEYEPYQLAGFPEDYVDVTYVPEIFEKEARKEEVPETLEEDAQDDLESSLKRHISVRHHESKRIQDKIKELKLMKNTKNIYWKDSQDNPDSQESLSCNNIGKLHEKYQSLGFCFLASCSTKHLSSLFVSSE
jgi:hypothetical protein